MPTNILYMPPVIMDMTVATNEDWIDGLEYQDLQTPSQPISLVGIAFEMELRVVAAAATVVLRAATDNNFIRVAGNTWQLLVPAPTMNLISPATYEYDMLGRGDGYTRRLARGSVTVVLGVTRSAAAASSAAAATNVVAFQPRSVLTGKTYPEYVRVA